ncbi:hypothetical protein FZ103_15860 [Streptomonospora sp. PA3]|uniref:hypothetical protein n=1 Tax=Streptomonospora sp. PA3 TaxID=2607326 RepID=UPI0012DE3079|nr:hypothetical protein [Streptomonospora sp. PA3]MUL42629.1 hypothetical protein [Streptomonospora sp. PA3]
MYGPPTFVNRNRGLLTAVYGVLCAAILALLAAMAVFGLSGITAMLLGGSQLLLLACMLLQTYLAWGYVTLTPEGIVVRDVRVRTLPWREIAMIRTKPFAARTVVEVRMADGRRRNLVAPSLGRAKHGRRFAEEVGLIQHWWAYCRGW